MTKTKYSILTVTLLALSSAAALAQTDASSIPVPDASVVQPIFDAAMGKFGWLAMVVTVLGSLRLVFKPVMLAIGLFVKSTPSTTDDEKVARFEASSLFHWLTWGLDYVASIKVPAKTAATTTTK